MSDDLNQPAGVQYDDWVGEVAGDTVDTVQLETFLGVDRDAWRLLLVDVTVYGGHQTIVGYVIPAGTTYRDLEAIVAAGNPIDVHPTDPVEYRPAEHFDTNPPAPLSFPVVGAGELIGHGFKRLHIRLRNRHVPPGAVLHVVDT